MNRFNNSNGRDPSEDWAIPRESSPLGHPLPLDEHACSVSLPTWQSVVGYEEGCTSVTSQLKCGYPRFVYHPYVVQLMNTALDIDRALQKETKKPHNDNARPKIWDCIVLPSRDSAIRCHDFLIKACGFCQGFASSPRFAQNYQGTIMEQIELLCPDNALDWLAESPPRSSGEQDNPWYNAKAPIRLLDLKAAGIFAVIFPAQTAFAIEAKSYWQHTGEIVSSRRAECALLEIRQKNQSTFCLSLKRFTSPYYQESNPQCHDDHSKSDAWKSCPFNTAIKHLAYHPSQIKEEKKKHSFHDNVRNHIADVTFTSPSCVFLGPSGMASIYTALRSARRRKIFTDPLGNEPHYNPSLPRGNGGTSIVYGFPYLDTLKMCSRPEFVPGGVEFFGFADEKDLNQLTHWLQHRKKQSIDRGDTGDAGVSILLTEYPSNPLLKCPDLNALRQLADQYDFALVVDDTIGNFANLDLLSSGLADAVCTSLTKLFSGRGDVIAGSIVTNPNTPIGRWMQQDLFKMENLYKRRKEEGSMLFVGDAAALDYNSKDFLQRSHKINKTAEAFADWLSDREEVANVYYPKYSCSDKYAQVLNSRPLPMLHSDTTKSALHFHHPGFGGLMSIILQPHICQRTFYDSLDISKGPSLGTNFTLVCPYTLLAHYHELDFAMSYNVPPNLLRISVGLEDLDVLKSRFSIAFQKSRLHPKVPPLTNHLKSEHVKNRRSFTTLPDHMYVTTPTPTINKLYMSQRHASTKRYLGRSVIQMLRFLHY